MTGNKTCARKVRHTSRRSARVAARKLQRKGEVGANAYYCDDCKGWHVGIAGAIVLVQCRSRRRDVGQKRERRSRQVAWQ